jgi:hypothetical protein
VHLTSLGLKPSHLAQGPPASQHRPQAHATHRHTKMAALIGAASETQACMQPGVNPYDAQSTDILPGTSSALSPPSQAASSHHVPMGGFTYAASASAGESRLSDQPGSIPGGTYINNGTYIPKREGPPPNEQATSSGHSDPRTPLGGPRELNTAKRGYEIGHTAAGPGPSGLSQPPIVHRTASQGLNGRNEASAGVADAPGTADVGNSRLQTTDWLTMDPHVSTVSAPDVSGRLGNALDNMAMSNKPFLGRFMLLSSMHRRAGGQGVVQVCP